MRLCPAVRTSELSSRKVYVARNCYTDFTTSAPDRLRTNVIYVNINPEYGFFL